MAQIKSSALYAITSKTIDSRPKEVIALIRKNGVMIPDGASSDTIDKAFISLITKSKAFQQQFAQLATKTVIEGNATISFDGSVGNDGAFQKSNLMFDGSVANDGAFKKSSLMFDGSVANDGGFSKSGFNFDGSVAQDGAFAKSNLSFDGSLARDGAMPMSNFKDVSNEVNFEGAFPRSSFDDVSTEVNFSGAGLSTSSTSSAPKPPTSSPISAPSKSGSSSSKKSGVGNFLTPEFVQGLLATGLSIWAYNKTGKTSDELKGNLDEGRNDPNYNAGNNNQPKGGLSTTGIVLISLGVITAIGVAVYFVRKK
tara:strand:- start:738 stop:1670 length:933 start_codon:yes stop_codon:yes gene_type:complete